MQRIALAGLFLAAIGSGGLAQGTSVPFGGLQQDTSLPVEITADRLEVVQETGAAVFTGGVVVGQGEMRLAAARLEVIYAQVGADGAPDGIERLLASGGVTLSNGAEAAEAQQADYTIATGAIVMTGNVLLTQGTNAVSGERLTIDLTTGSGVMEGRVTTILQPPGATE